LGLARTVRVLETFGRAMREMKSAPEKIVILEVALVRLIKPELDASLDALTERVTRLERGVKAPTPDVARPAPLGPIGSTATTAHSTSVTSSNATFVESVEEPRVEGTAPTSRAAPTPALDLAIEDVRERFVQRVVPRTSRAAQLLLKAAQVRSLDGQVLTIALASEEMRQNTEMITQGLRSALDHEFKCPLTVAWIVDSTLTSSPPSAPVLNKEPVAEVIDEVYSSDETAIIVTSAADHLITEMFPGAEEIR
jgi:hypothetical protein